MQDISLKGLRVLILEDEALIALDLEQVFRDLGADEVIIAHSLDGLDAAFDIAVLDVTLAGRPMAGFAAELFARGVALVFVTCASDAAGLLDGLPGVQIVDKLFSDDAIERAIAEALRLAREGG